MIAPALMKMVGNQIHHRSAAAAMQRGMTATIPLSRHEKAGCTFCTTFAGRALRSRPAEIRALHHAQTSTTIGI